jgi:L-ribulokinase
VSYALGIDYGTESARAVLVDCTDGSELGQSIEPYRNGVIDARLPAPDSDVELEPDWALQDPDDYVRALEAAVPRLLVEAGVTLDEVVGIGVDFTSCTMLPALADGTPLCRLDELRREPHAWVKLWKHHAAQPEADRINAVALERGEPWLPRYGGKISSEWFFAKALQILDEAPEVYARAERLIEACDWIVWQLTGVESRSACAAGYKAMWSKRDGFPAQAFFAALDPRVEHGVDERMSRTLLLPGARAGGLSERAAARLGLRPGTPVAAGNVDFHASLPATTVAEPGTLVMIMGTSNGHLLLGERLAHVEGMCGVVEDGIVPGFFGYEAGQSALGDIFAWFTREAARLRPGESGLLALDWWNGNRSVLVDAGLRGLIVGMTLATRPPDI